MLQMIDAKFRGPQAQMQLSHVVAPHQLSLTHAEIKRQNLASKGSKHSETTVEVSRLCSFESLLETASNSVMETRVACNCSGQTYPI